MRRARGVTGVRLAAVAAVVALGGCGGVSPDPGVGAPLTVAGAQYLPDGLPAAGGGPRVLAVTSTRPTVAIGRADERLRGVLDHDARAAIIALRGAGDAWLLPAGPPDLDTPTSASLAARFALADDTTPGPITIDVAATDAAGRVGPPTAIDLVADDVPPPPGTLVVALAWDGAADLDLHVVDPTGGEAWSQRPNTWTPPPPGEPVDPTAYLAGGILDHDGNAGCARDGRPREAIRWQQPPPAGTYVVRVDARAMCGAPAAAWYVAAYRDGALLGAARGLATDADTLGDHGAGAGVLALTLAVP